jgi:predicted dehydrogenase
MEELIRWRLWDRTGAGLMAELGSHQLDAASIFVAAAHKAAGASEDFHPHPLNVVAMANRALFPADRDVEDHVLCILEFPAPGFDPKAPPRIRKTIGVQYSSINGNGFGGYGEVVFGTKGTLILEREQVLQEPSSGTEIKVGGGAGGPTMDTQSSGPAHKLAASGPGGEVSRGYAEELEHWAWCIRNPDKENLPRCHPRVAMGDAVIALTTNMAAREGKRIEFKEEWFDPDRDETPEGVKPDLTRYKA